MLKSQRTNAVRPKYRSQQMHFLRGYRMSARHTVRMAGFSFFAAIVACCGNITLAQSSSTLEQRLKKIMDRPEFAHSRFGVKFISAE